MLPHDLNRDCGLWVACDVVNSFRLRSESAKIRGTVLSHFEGFCLWQFVSHVFQNRDRNILHAHEEELALRASGGCRFYRNTHWQQRTTGSQRSPSQEVLTITWTTWRNSGSKIIKVKTEFEICRIRVAAEERTTPVWTPRVAII